MAKQNNQEVRVRGIGKKLQEELKNVAGNIGTNSSDFVKTLIAEKINSYPEHMKKPPLKD